MMFDFFHFVMILVIGYLCIEIYCLRAQIRNLQRIEKDLLSLLDKSKTNYSFHRIKPKEGCIDLERKENKE